MATDLTPTPSLTWEAPAPGAWELEATHHGTRPVSRIMRDGLKTAFESGTTTMVARYGLPLEGIRVEFVNGCTYMRPVGLGEGAEPKPPPPALIMKAIAHLHPGMRRRNRAAVEAWDERRWRHEVDRWFEHDRAEVVRTNLDFQRTDLANLDNEALVDHLSAVHRHFITQAELNMANHGGDLMPVGDYLAHCESWGIDEAVATSLLTGASPATVETVELLAPVTAALAAVVEPPTSIDGLRTLGPAASDAIDQWLELHGWRLVTSDDVDKPTLAERPDLQRAALLAAARAEGAAAGSGPDPDPVRATVPDDQRAEFDRLLAEARYGMRQRDDIVGIRWNWSGGLLRRGLLEAGRRLTAAGRLTDPEHAADLELEELRSLLLEGVGPTGDEVAERAAFRDIVENAHPPEMLGDPEAPPPIDALPAPMARATMAMMAVMEAEGLSGNGAGEPLHGVGIGDTPYRGRARVAASADDALDRLEPGDVLIAPFTGPAYNSIIPILGALVVDAGGTMCHAAIVAREFGLPAVIGASGATSDIPDGAMVEVDPVAGVVRVVT